MLAILLTFVVIAELDVYLDAPVVAVAVAVAVALQLQVVPLLDLMADVAL